MSSQSQTHVGDRGGLSSQDGVSQKQGDTLLSIPQINHLYETSIVRGEDASNTTITVIPEQSKVTRKLTVFFHLQEQFKNNMTVDCSTSVA